MRRSLLAFVAHATAAVLLAGCGVRSSDDRTRVDEAHKAAACATGDGSLCVGATLPQLAVDSRHGRMLVVWRQQTTPNVTWLTGRLIGSDAHPVGGPRALGRLGSADDRQVTIRYDPQRDRYVIGWAGQRHAVTPDLRRITTLGVQPPVSESLLRAEDPNVQPAATALGLVRFTGRLPGGDAVTISEADGAIYAQAVN